MKRENEGSIIRQDYTPQSNDRQEHISASHQNSQVTVDTFLSTDVENVDETVEMPEYHLFSETSAVHNVDFTEDKNADIINFDVPDKFMFFKKKSKLFTFPSKFRQIYYVLQLVSLTQGLDWIDTNIISASRLAAEESGLPAFVTRWHPMFLFI